MNRNFILITLTTGLLFLFSCQKDTSVFVADKGEITGPDTSWYAAVTADMPIVKLKNSLALALNTDSFEVNDHDMTIADPSGIEFIFPPQSSADINNDPVSGMVETSSLLIKKKGDFIRMNVPTVVSGKLLVSGAAYFIALQKDGNRVRLSPGKTLTASYTDTSFSAPIQVFNADAGIDINWIKNNDPDNNYVSALNQSLYKMVSNRLSWTSCGYFYDMNAVQTTSIATDMPRNFTNFTTAVYIVFKNFRSVVNLSGNTAAHAFTSIPLPAGQIATVVVISKQGDYYYMGQQQIMTAKPAQGTHQIVSINPVRASLDNIKAYLGTL